MSAKTYTAKPGEIERRWHVVDAEGQTLGRLATRIADVLRGKDKPVYTPHVDTGDFVVVVNAMQVKLTGNKREAKLYHRHTGWPGGLKTTNAAKVLDGAHPERVLEAAVRGMLPKNHLGRQMFSKLKVYGGAEHPHAAQKPEVLPLA